jgi:hypothetical protein
MSEGNHYLQRPLARLINPMTSKAFTSEQFGA